MSRRDTCIVISGQIRDDVAQLSKFQDLADEINADIVISTWRMSGAKLDGPLRLPQRERILGRDIALGIPYNWSFDDLWQHIPLLQERTRSYLLPISEDQVRRVLPAARIDIEDSVMDLSLSSWDPNSLRMTYKIWRANRLKRQLEHERGRKYETVLRVRPDYICTASVVSVAEDLQSVAYVPWEDASGIADEAALMSSEVADHYSDLFLKCAASPGRDWRGIHIELKEHLIQHSVQIRADRAIFGNFVEKPFLQQALIEVAGDNGAIGASTVVASVLLSAGKNQEALEQLENMPPDEESKSAALLVASEVFRRAGDHRKAFALGVLALYDKLPAHVQTAERPFLILVLNNMATMRFVDPGGDHFGALVGLIEQSAREAQLPWLGQSDDTSLEQLARASVENLLVLLTIPDISTGVEYMTANRPGVRDLLEIASAHKQ